MAAYQVWRSERLLYRGVDKDDDAFLAKLNQDPEAYLNSSPYLPIPRSRKTAEDFREFLVGCLVGAIVCIPSGEDPDDVAKATPIGILHLAGGNEPHLVHHRHSEIGVSIIRQYQNSGYGTEAVKWLMEWGFRRCNLHRIGIGAFAWNAGAVKLYQKLGFQLEGTKRDYFWHDGRYQDAVELAILEDEWRERYDDRRQTATSTLG